MFHNMQKNSPIKNQKQKEAPASDSVQQESAGGSNITSNSTKIITQPSNQKESEAMNAPQSKDNQGQAAQGENRVDIPGNIFNRPNQAQAAQGSRPAYPGSYPGASAAQASAPAAYTPATANEAESTGRKLVIGQGISLSGEIEACDHLIVEGTVEAALKGANNMEISETGAFYGTVEIEEATIAGRFEGDLTVRGRLTVQSTGSIVGSIAYKELAIEAGAMIEGSVTPLDSQNAGKSKKGQSKVKTKVRQDNSAELPFADKVAS